ncbi:MAG: hypothetical protein JRI85_08745 [Deltaproteobacteria bacterium]|nr:hypothetical protein [Deltaproteobacteria bacterium]
MFKNKIAVRLGILILILGAGFLLQTAALLQEKSDYSKLLSTINRKQIQDEEYSQNLKKIKSIVADNVKSPAEIIQRSMEFVHDNSLNIIDDERDRYLYQMSLDEFLKEGTERLLKASQNDSYSKPHLSCGLRSQLMKVILDQSGIYARIVQIFSDKDDVLKAHRLLEVFNPEIGVWELWDPDHRVVYINRNSGKPVDGVFFVFGERSKVVPQNGEIRGWEETKTSHIRDNFAGAVMFEYTRATSPGNLIIINRKQFDSHKVFNDGSTFKHFAAESLNFPRIIFFQ